MAVRSSFASVFAAAALLATPAFAADLDRACTPDTVGHLPVAAESLKATVAAIFDRPAAQSAQTEDGVAADFSTMEVLVVRVKDGKPVVACVDTKQAAEEFLDAPLSKIGNGKRAEEK